MTREEAIKILKRWQLRTSNPTDKQLGYVEGWVHKEDIEALQMAVNLLEADDVAPVIHAKWIGFPYKCSNCGQRAPQETYYGVDGLETSDYTSKFCPNCAAKMDKE